MRLGLFLRKTRRCLAAHFSDCEVVLLWLRMDYQYQIYVTQSCQIAKRMSSKMGRLGVSGLGA